MLNSFSEFKFYQSFRIPIEKGDDIRFSAAKVSSHTGLEEEGIKDAELVDLSVTGLGLKTKERLSVGKAISLLIQFRKQTLEIDGTVVRAFSSGDFSDDFIIYGIEFEAEKEIFNFLKNLINSFSPERLKSCLVTSALREKYTSAEEGLEMLSLILSLFRDLSRFANHQEFAKNILKEVNRLMNAQKSTVFLINPETNELESVESTGVETAAIKFDYRKGVAGSVFTTGLSQNIDLSGVSSGSVTLEAEEFSVGTSEIKSLICNPIYNREDKVVGVLQVINKKNEDRFNTEDERTMKVMSLVFTSIFHNFNPISEKSQVRRFSKPFDRQLVLIGKTPVATALRATIPKMKDIDAPLLLSGEAGVGKTLLAQIIHVEGRRGLSPFEVVDVLGMNEDSWHQMMAGEQSVFNRVKKGTILFKNIDKLSSEMQSKLLYVLNIEGAPFREVGREPLACRVMATTKTDLIHLVEEGKFNRYLYDYLTQAQIQVDPLRKRKNDIKVLVDYFLKVECKKRGLLLKSFTDSALKAFADYDWPGNIQELKISVERAVLYNPKAHYLTDLSSTATPLFDRSKSSLKMFDDIPFVNDVSIDLKDRMILVERKMIEAEIKRQNQNKSKAARSLGISREALRKKLIQAEEVLAKLENNKEKLPENKAA